MPWRWRKMTWVIWIWTISMGVWAIGGGSQNCGGAKKGAELAGCQIGTGIGITLILFAWFVGFIVLSLIWFMTRPRFRQCPQCGRDVKKGQLQCKRCGYSFVRAVGTP